MHKPGRNRLLSALPRTDWERIQPQMQRMPAALGQVLHEANAPLLHAYFPLDGLVSLVVAAADGITVEAGVVGNEGMVGTALALGADRSTTKAFFQTPGDYLRMTSRAFRDEIDRRGALCALVKRYTQAMVMQLAQSVLCNRLHSVEERLARWILISHDRVAGDELQLTQEFIAEMLGVRRASVSVVAGALQQAGLIGYARGRITVIDRPRLEEAACECYAAVRAVFDEAIAAPSTSD